MLRITPVIDGPHDVTLKLEGCIAAEWTAVLRDVCRCCLAQHRRVRLDFAQVTFIDRQGLAVLKELACEALTIVSCSTLVRELLEAAAIV